MAFLPSKSYADVPSAPSAHPAALPHIDDEASPIDNLVQHPIEIPPPTDTIRVKPHGVILTKKEQKKMKETK